IRLQIEAARDQKFDRDRDQAIHALLEQHALDWLGPLANIISGYIFRRGFIDEITLVAEQYLQNEATIFAFIPVRKVKFRGVESHERALAKSAGLARLDGIDLGYNDLQPDDLRRVF